jgi:hypothetical protein
MTALPKTVPYIYAVCAADDARTQFAEDDAARLLELFAKLGQYERDAAFMVLEALALISRSRKADANEDVRRRCS